MIVGTCYFVSVQAANEYYGNDALVHNKLLDGEIHIGHPPLKPGDKLILVDGGRRWAIEERSKA